MRVRQEQSPDSKKRKLQCYKCFGFGHMAFECPDKSKKDGEGKGDSGGSRKDQTKHKGGKGGAKWRK